MAFAVEMGERVAPRMEMEMGCCWERREKASRGPAASRSWKPGKRIMPIFVGRGEDMVII